MVNDLVWLVARINLVLAAGEAAANGVEHARHPTEPFFDVQAEIEGHSVRIVVRDYGRWTTPIIGPGSITVDTCVLVSTPSRRTMITPSAPVAATAAVNGPVAWRASTGTVV